MDQTQDTKIGEPALTVIQTCFDYFIVSEHQTSRDVLSLYTLCYISDVSNRHIYIKRSVVLRIKILRFIK